MNCIENNQTSNSTQPTTDDFLASLVLRHIVQTLSEGENSKNASYLMVEALMSMIGERLVRNEAFIQKIAEKISDILPNQRENQDLYSVGSTADKLNYNRKYFPRIAEEKFGLKKIYIGNRVFFAAAEVDKILTDMIGATKGGMIKKVA